jgi:hypothetical protein
MYIYLSWLQLWDSGLIDFHGVNIYVASLLNKLISYTKHACWRSLLNINQVTNGTERVLFENLVVVQVFNKFPAFYGNWKFIIICRSPPSVFILSRMNPVAIATFF